MHVPPILPSYRKPYIPLVCIANCAMIARWGCTSATMDCVDGYDDANGGVGKLTTIDDVANVFGGTVEDEAIARFSS